MNYQTWLLLAAERLSAGESPKRDAEVLLSFVTGKGRTFLLAFGETVLTDTQQQRLDALLTRRINGEPIAYLTGEREFWSLSLAVSPATLIPRPDTECLVEQALQRLPPAPSSILDLGTGTGAIALAIASERPDCQVIGVDVQPEAVALASRNASRLGIANAGFLVSDWFSALSPERFALIVSNPPYIDADDAHLSRGDVRFEPDSALVAAENGLADLRFIIENAVGHIQPQGWLLLEHGWRQGAAVRQLLQARGFQRIETCQDYGGNDRVSLGQWSGR
ncbi:MULTISPECIES: peptide chain release factor N(5)-glutamine methyltransferase [unclassified Brenneria]|uniref:peptide chain release factor N(5)-glutamine methyltransferase n=1 Tax=unclassified Brenneria TaxID=2634434 RepID=UPI001556E1AD|nr:MULTISPECIES: peptide chain release factor N(5)-glutamine methyltransferase [unclassified Brenneria]MBJ7220828.1 peptide chain release factor N(5)-glutamine methyltransferase [Brenneria sp. L3-3C-1]MEE3642068.1 peptide chain release factor N(5)-glutamine methyltransferase [Brenneria sp. L3_3C_1]MEE3649235.1 peptide chain release factor N(5)-glutamine methyltransferase [Brenneria sp. HEZEL_4_2_4]NPC99188.1 peptide chain release factor N(5)-glutamine methyltransferase [Brenneria sp. hezel4-2-4